MASITDCIEKLVVAGQITRKAADQALSLHERMKGQFSRDMPPAAADAAAALQAARTLRQNAAERLRNVAGNVNTFRAGEQRLAEHPMGKLAALAGMLTRDLWRDAEAFRNLPAESLVKSGPNVEGKYRATANWLFQKFAAGMEAFKPGIAGHTEQQLTGIKNMLREIRGVDTGDAVAKKAAKGWTAAIGAAVERAQQGGKIFAALEDWHTPQFWTGWRVKKLGFDEFRKDLLEAESSGAMTIFDRDTNKPVADANREFVIRRAYEDIVQTGGGSAPFSKEHRTFNFGTGELGAEAHARLMEKYGWGNNPMKAFVGHLDHMAHDIGLIETFGPNYEANFRALLRQAKANPEIPKAAGAERFNPARFLAQGKLNPLALESPATIEGTWKVLTGQVHAVHDDAISSWLGAIRNMNIASALRQAIFSVLPTDAVTQLLAANHVGMAGLDHMANIFTGGLSRDEAAHLNIQAHSAMEYVNGIRDFEHHVSLMQSTQKVASTFVKATGLQWWGDMGRRTWAGDMLNLFAQQSDKAFDKIDPKFRRFLDAYGFTEADWSKLRSSEMLDLGGAKYLDPNKLDRPLYERVLNAIQEQGAFAMHQPDARLRSIETGAAFGLNPGQAQEIARSFFQFKTFALSRMSTQLMRILIDGPIENRIARGIAFMTLSMGAAAGSIQALQLLNGKDPLPMNTAGFWGRAFVKGGVGGYYGDLVEAALHGGRTSGDVLTALGGPVAGLTNDVLRLMVAPIREEFDETQNVRRSTLGRQAVNMIRRNTPNTWYARLAIDRLWFDKLQTLVDPDYRGSWRRMQQRARKEGQGFWWGSGESAPERAPNLGTAFGQ